MTSIYLPILYRNSMMLQREKQIQLVCKAHAHTLRLVISRQDEIIETLTASAGTSDASTAGTSDVSTAGTSDVSTAGISFVAIDTPIPHDPAAGAVNPTPDDATFALTIPALEAGFGYQLDFYADEDETPSRTITDVCAGDLFLACGQSNMEFFLRYDADWNYTKKLPHNPQIRMFNVPQIAFEGQERNLPFSGKWFEEGDPAWAEFSAPGYYFARDLQPTIGVPVGIIGCNWGGTPACAWMGEEYLKKSPLDVFDKEYDEAVALYSPEELKRKSDEGWASELSYYHELEFRPVLYGMTTQEQELFMKMHEGDPEIPMGPWHMYRPHGVYHTMMERIAHFPVKGVLWYQGESDAGHADIYDQTMEALIQCFRDSFDDPQLPFFFVQLAPFGKWLACDNEGYAEVRTQQQKVADTVPFTGMVSILDLGSYEDIHPKFKKEVGHRLALQAKRRIYEQDVCCEAPIPLKAEKATVVAESTAPDGALSDMTVSSSARLSADAAASYAASHHDDEPITPGTHRTRNRITISFCNTGGHLVSDDTPGEGFVVTQNGKKLVLTSAEVYGKSVLLVVDDIDETAPVHVSYCEENYAPCHLWSAHGLSMRPFHVDIP